TPADVAKAVEPWSAPLPKEVPGTATPSVVPDSALQTTAKPIPTVAWKKQPGWRKTPWLVGGMVLVAAAIAAVALFSPEWFGGILEKYQAEPEKKDASPTTIAKAVPKAQPVTPTSKDAPVNPPPPTPKPSPGLAHLQRGQAHLLKLDLPQAIAELNKAIEL